MTRIVRILLYILGGLAIATGIFLAIYFTRQPCKSHEKKCGDTCCEPQNCKDGLCCHPHEINCNGKCCTEGNCCNGICCEPDTSCMDGMCCKTGDVNCNGKCCPEEKCCNGVCCADGEVCVNGICCKTGDVNCDGKCCPAEKCCNGVCCADGEVCVNGICCKTGDVNCDGKCCDGKCCGKVCCGKHQQCNPNNNSCVKCDEPLCNGECCKDGQTCTDGVCCKTGNKVCNGVCCSDPSEECINNVCCNKDNICGDNCCSSSQSCIDNKCCDKTKICGDKCCDDPNKVCINNVCCDKSKACSKDNVCCDTECCNGVCCPKGTKCINGTCMTVCGTKYCHPDTQTCKIAKVGDKETDVCINKGCEWGTLNYDPANLLIDGNIVKTCKSPAGLITCSDPETQGPFTKSSNTVQKSTIACSADDCYYRAGTEIGAISVTYDADTKTCTTSLDCKKQLDHCGECPLPNIDSQSCCLDEKGKFGGLVCPDGKMCVDNKCYKGWGVSGDSQQHYKCELVSDGQTYSSQEDCMEELVNNPTYKACATGYDLKKYAGNKYACFINTPSCKGQFNGKNPGSYQCIDSIWACPGYKCKQSSPSGRPLDDATFPHLACTASKHWQDWKNFDHSGKCGQGVRHKGYAYCQGLDYNGINYWHKNCDKLPTS